MTVKTFQCSTPDATYLFKNGEKATFDKDGKFATDDPQKHAELEAEIAGGHPTIAAVADPVADTTTATAPTQTPAA